MLDNYYYRKITNENDFKQIQSMDRTLNKKLTNNLITKLLNDDIECYMMISDYNILGFFAIKEEHMELFTKKTYNIIKILCIHIFKEYRLRGYGTEILNDIQWSVKNNNNKSYEYILANSFVKTAMFFLNNGFDFYKNNKKLDVEEHMILMYKKID